MVYTNLVDYFISYKRKDTEQFAMALNFTLRARGGFDGWLDTTEIRAGQSILSEIEKGITNSLSVITILSSNFFDGWSDRERKIALHLANARNVVIIPIWYDVNYDFILDKAPMLADLKAIVCDTKNQSMGKCVMHAYEEIEKTIKPIDKGDKLFELYFRCLHKHFPNDPEVTAWIAMYDNNMELLGEALEQKFNPNISKVDILNRYSRDLLFGENNECYDSWISLRRWIVEYNESNSPRHIQLDDDF